MIEITTENNLSEVLSQNDKAIVLFGAAWCGNCRMVKPKFKNLASEHSDVTFVYVDAEKSPDARKHAKIVNLPTFASFKGGELVSQCEGNKIEHAKELISTLV